MKRCHQRANTFNSWQPADAGFAHGCNGGSIGYQRFKWQRFVVVAEAPLSLIVMVLPDAARIDLLVFVFRDPLTMVLAAGVLIAPGILVGLIAHRLGWGE